MKIWTNNKSGVAYVTLLTLMTLATYALCRQPMRSARSLAKPEPTNDSLWRAEDSVWPMDPAPIPDDAVSESSRDVSLVAQVDRGTLLAGSDGDVHVALTLRASEATSELPTRRPSDVLVVLDVSGSMSGPKLAHAKQALHELIGRLSSEDRFGLVTYESQAHLLLPLTLADAPASARFHRVVDELTTAGGTNMSAGLDLALEEVKKQARSARGARVLLLSDGHANQGDSSQSGLSGRVRALTWLDDVVSTLGIGDDFNEDLMTSLAEAGTGNFYYLSRVEKLASYFDAELRAASQTVASAIELRFAPAAGVELLELSGYPIERAAKQVTVRPGNLIQGQERRLWATLRAPTEDLRDVALGKFSLRFKRGGTVFEAVAPPLPALACVADAARFEASIARPLWEEYVATEQYLKVQAKLGWAVAAGDSEDIERERQGYEQNRALAEKFGSTRVLDRLRAMALEAEEAKDEQESPDWLQDSKQRKARALFERRRDAYNSDPMLGL
jgi:Ca-activated chloride channel family protein